MARGSRLLLAEVWELEFFADVFRGGLARCELVLLHDRSRISSRKIFKKFLTQEEFVASQGLAPAALPASIAVVLVFFVKYEFPDAESRWLYVV